MKKVLFLFLFASFLIYPYSVCSAQTKELSGSQIDKLKSIPTNYFIGLSFTNMVPQKEFFDNLPKSGQGFSLYGGFNADPMPLAFGLEFDFLFNGSNTKYRDTSAFFEGLAYIRHDTVSTQSMVIPINIFARYQPDIMGYESPYVEAILGLHVLTNSQNFNSGIIFPGDTVYPDKISDSKSSVALHYGVGVGVLLKLVDFVGLPASHSSLNFDILLRYLLGSEAKYQETESVGFDNNKKPFFNVKDYKSKTDMIIFTAGFVFKF